MANDKSQVTKISNVVQAHPTKQFFIDMLTKDIDLTRSIIDLVDNSIDGARRNRGNGDYAGLFVRLEADENHFKIADNCGGMSVHLARNYAFRFGRPEEMPATPHSVGQFGVGMKRALFKLGKKFKVESTTLNSHFVIEQDVDEWKADADNWVFRFKELEERQADNPADNQGTIITVALLLPAVADEFRLENFRSRLVKELEAAHALTMEKGLAITINQIPLAFRPSELLDSAELRSAFREMTLQQEGVAPVIVKMYAGVSESNPDLAGWNVYCNGRLVLESDQTATTGWGEGGETAIPKYHNQFARFRGYIFFESDNAGLLPWNTTKTGVDEGSQVYRAVRLQMVNLMRPVIDFLNKLDAEKGQDSRPLETAIDAAASAPLHEVKTAEVFTSPKPEAIAARPRETTISYKKPLEEVDRAKRKLGVYSNRDVGERTFEYYLKMETEE